MSEVRTGLGALVAQEDQPLMTLSNEQYHALWAAEWVEADPTLAPMMQIMRRTLAAAGVVETALPGDAYLTGPGAFVHEIHDRAETALVVRFADKLRARCLVRVGGDAVLEHARHAEGLNDFTLRRIDRTLDDIVRECLAGVPSEQTTTETVSEDDDLDHLVQTSMSWGALEVVPRPVSDWPVTDFSWSRASLLLGTDAAGTGWCAVAEVDGWTLRRPIDRSTAGGLVRGLLASTGIVTSTEA